MSEENKRSATEKVSDVLHATHKFLYHRTFAESYLAAGRKEQAKAAKHQEIAEAALEDLIHAQIDLLGPGAVGPLEALAKILLHELPTHPRLQAAALHPNHELMVGKLLGALDDLAHVNGTDVEKQSHRPKG